MSITGEPQHPTGPVVKSAPPCLRVARPSEESDDYPVVARLSGTARVIVCRNGLQWILQLRAGQRSGRPRWASRSFCCTREALVRCAREHAGEIAADALVTLLSLPERIGGAR
jgi:hypothetical protein